MRKITFEPISSFGGPKVFAVLTDGEHRGTVIKYGRGWMVGQNGIFPSVCSTRKKAAENLLWQLRGFKDEGED